MSQHTIVVTAIIYHDETGMIGFVENFVGVTARGRTAADVLKSLRRAVQFHYANNAEAIAMMMQPVIMNARREHFSVEVEFPDDCDVDR